MPKRTWTEEPVEWSEDDRLERLCSSYADPADRVIELERQGYVIIRGQESDHQE